MKPPPILLRAAAAIAVLHLGGILVAQTPTPTIASTSEPVNLAEMVELGTMALTSLSELFRANGGDLVGDDPGAAAERAATNAIWLAVRADGRDGIGTEEDPRDASTAAKVDAIFVTLPAGSDIRLKPGLYETGGAIEASRTSGVVLKAGSRLAGAGQDRTTIKLKAGAMPAGTYTALSPLRRDLIISADDTIGAHVSDLTVDANKADQSAYTAQTPEAIIFYINLTGASCSIRHVTVRGGWNSSETIEGFPVTISSVTGNAATPAVGIIDSVTSEFFDGYCTMFNLVTSEPGRISGRITNTIIRELTSGGYSKVQGAGAGGMQGVEIAGNYWDGVRSGVFTDTWSYSDVTVRNNYIRVRADPLGLTGFGVFCGGGPSYSWRDWKITDNHFVLSRNTAALRIVGNTRRMLFARNEVMWDGVPGGGFNPYMVSVVAAGGPNTGLRIEGNRLDTAGSIGGVGDTGAAAALVWSSGNRMIDGATIPGVREDDPTQFGRAYDTSDPDAFAGDRWAPATTSDRFLSIKRLNQSDFADPASHLLRLDNYGQNPLDPETLGDLIFSANSFSPPTPAGPSSRPRSPAINRAAAIPAISVGTPTRSARAGGNPSTLYTASSIYPISAGTSCVESSATAATATLPAIGSVSQALGTAMIIVNRAGTGTLTVKDSGGSTTVVSVPSQMAVSLRASPVPNAWRVTWLANRALPPQPGRQRR